MSEGPKRLTLEEYRARQQKTTAKDWAKVPIVKPPKRRGGYIAKKRRELALLHRAISTNPPPPWEVSSRIWNKINEVEEAIKAHRMSK